MCHHRCAHISYFTITANVTFRVRIIRFVRLINKLIACSQINYVCFRPRCAGYLVLFWSLSIRNARLASAGLFFTSPFFLHHNEKTKNFYILICGDERALIGLSILRQRTWNNSTPIPFWKQEVTSSFFGWPGWWCWAESWQASCPLNRFCWWLITLNAIS